MKYAISALALAGMWFLWSGHFSLDHGMVAGFGVASVALVLYLSHRMEIIDIEGQPLLLGPWLIGYAPYLTWQIITSNIRVAKRILNPKLPINPGVVQVQAQGEHDLTHVIFANSITLTPGTLSLEIDDGTITIHALHHSGAAMAGAGVMQARVAKLEELV